MELTAVHHVGLVVTDLDRSIYFYHDLLGLPFANEPTPWFEGPALAKGVGVQLEAKGVQFYSDVNVVDECPLAGWRWVYFSDPDGLTLELVEVAYYRKAERDAAAAEYLRTRPALR